MARAFNGSTQYLSASSTLLSDEPIGMFCWGKPDNLTSNAVSVAIGDNSATVGIYILQWAGSEAGVAGDPIRGVKNDDSGTGFVIAFTSTGYSTAWHSASASFRNNTSRDAYLDGGNKGSDTNSRADPTPDFISIGALKTSIVYVYFAGLIADVFLVDADVTDAQHLAYGKGYSILWNIPIKNVRAWYPLLRDDRNRMAGGYPDLTPTGSPTVSAHPPNVVHPRIGALMTF